MRAGQKLAIVLVLALVLMALTIPPVAFANHWHSCFGKQVTIRGTHLPDVLRGTDERDVIVGMGGDDTIFGNGGKDRLCGNRGNDTIIGGGGFDRARGGRGDDFCDAERTRRCES